MENEKYTILNISEDEYIIVLGNRITSSNVPDMLTDIKRSFKTLQIRSLTVDMMNVIDIDDYAMLILNYLKRTALDGGGRYQMINASDDVKEILAFFTPHSAGAASAGPVRGKGGLINAMGEWGLQAISDAERVTLFVGDTVIAAFHALKNPFVVRWNDVINYIRLAGIDAIPIVGLISFLLGLIMAFMSSVQLKQFGANVYVASLVGLSMVRELGPIMTCIIIAGRSGSAFAAEIGSMKISEEVDALDTMGFDLTIYLVLPKIIALVVAAPILTIISDIFANLGGLLVGVTMLDLTTESYTQQFLKTVTLNDLYIGLFKSGLFGMLIGWVGCYQGMQVEGGADAVGKASTAAVVNGIFLIIVADSLIAVLLRYWS